VEIDIQGVDRAAEGLRGRAPGHALRGLAHLDRQPADQVPHRAAQGRRNHAQINRPIRRKNEKG